MNFNLYHFDFQSWSETVESAEKINAHISNPTLVFFKAINRIEVNKTTTYQDERLEKKPIQ